MGSVVDAPIHVEVMEYDLEHAESRRVDSTAELEGMLSPDRTTWINLDGVHRVEEVTALGKLLGIHPLWIEDVLNTDCRPKLEAIGEQLLVVARMALPARGTGDPLETEQVSLVKGPNWVVTFQERPGDIWDPQRQRILDATGRIRRKQADYLLHALLDQMVDHYFLALEHLEDRVDTMESDALNKRRLDLDRLFALRSELASFRRMVWPLREVTSQLHQDEAGCLQEANLPYFRDLYDHVLQVMEIIETDRDRIQSVFELHLAVNGHQLNRIIRILTVVSTVFIPLTFIVGVYGMNFAYMPELQWRWGYPVVMLGMLGLALSMLAWFRTRRWM